MDKQLAGAIALNLNLPKIIDTINLYADAQIEILRLRLETSHDLGEIRSLQGGIEQLKQLKKIREHALSVIEVERNR